MKAIVIALVLSLLCLPVFAAERPILDIKEITSPGGLTVWLAEDHTLPIVALDFAFRDAGSAHDPVAKQGLTYLATRLMTQGAGDMDSRAFQKALDDQGISLSFSGTRDYVGGSVKTLVRHQDRAFDLLALALHKPRFDPAALEREVKIQKAALRANLADGSWLAFRLLHDYAFAGHAYGLNSGGTMTSLDAITQADLRAFGPARFTRDRLVVVVAGAMTAETAGKTADRLFGTLPAVSKLAATPDIVMQNGGKSVLYPLDVEQTTISAVLPYVGHKDPDYAAATVLDHIFGASGFGSRLMDEIREKRGLTYGVYSSDYELRHATLLTVNTSTRHEQAGAVLDLIRSTMEPLKTTPVGAQELADTISYITGSMPLGLSSTDRIADAMLTLRLNDLPPDYYDSYRAAIRAVSAQDVQRVAQRLLDPSKMLTILVGKPAGVKTDLTLESLPNVQ